MSRNWRQANEYQIRLKLVFLCLGLAEGSCHPFPPFHGGEMVPATRDEVKTSAAEGVRIHQRETNLVSATVLH